MKYKSEVRSLTHYNKKILLKNWNGLDYYDNEYIKENFIFKSNDRRYPTIDHKTSIVYGFKNGFTLEYIGSIDNICVTKRKLNSKKHMLTEIEFKTKYYSNNWIFPLEKSFHWQVLPVSWSITIFSLIL